MTQFKIGHELRQLAQARNWQRIKTRTREEADAPE